MCFKKRKTSKATREVEQPKPAAKKSAKKPPKKRGRKRRNLRVPNTMAVVFTLPPELQDGKKPLFADLFKTCRGAVDLGEIGLEGGVKFRETATGARLMELPKGTSSDKADLLVSKLKQSLPQEVRITRPVKCADVRISYLDDSITKEDISDAIAKKGGCSLEHIRVGEIRTGPSRMGSVWARCPVAAAKTLSEGRLLIGWSSTRVTLLEPRPLRCFRCLELGHTRARCSALADRSDLCYRCGKPGHKSAECSAPPHCAICAVAGKDAKHTLGGRNCSPPSIRSSRAARKPPAADRAPPAAQEEPMATDNNV
ncbi:hypothetical protein ACJJTC_004982 [Scirpophaga incertulas]